jgi:hypothetical protein
MSNVRLRGCILTAERLADGAVVFLDFEGDWSEHLTAAVVAHGPDEQRALADRAGYEAARNLVVYPYLVEVEDVDGNLIPARYRERVRIAGARIFADVPGYGSPSRTEREGETAALAAFGMPTPHSTGRFAPCASARSGVRQAEGA